MALVYNEITGEFEEKQVNPDIEFIKSQFKRIEKNEFFRYIAITNNLIGTASMAKCVKPLWISNPQSFLFKNPDVKHLYHRFSTDGGLSFSDFPYDLSTDNFDNAVNYTYKLFTKMGLMSQFREKGKQAVDYMVNNDCLKYH